MLSIDVYFGIRRRFFCVESGEYHASFDCPVREKFEVSSAHFSRKFDCAGGFNKSRRRRGGSTMLFPIIHDIDAPKIVDGGFSPAVVRLKSLKDSHGALTSSGESASCRSLPFLSFASERKLNAFLFIPVLWNRKGECNVIKARAQLIGNLTEEDAEFWRKRFDIRDPQMIPPISVWLDRESIEVRFAMGLGDCISSLEVNVCPINLSPDKTEIWHD